MSQEDEWIILSSAKEEKIFSFEKERKLQEKKKLESLKRNGILAQKRKFRNKLSLVSIPANVANSRLDAFYRSRILHDALYVSLPEWKKKIAIILVKAEVCSLINSKTFILDKDVDKDILRDLNNFTFSASAFAGKSGLTRDILIDIIWSSSICLCKNTSLALQRPLYLPEIEIIQDCSLSLVNSLLFFWQNKVNNCGNIFGKISLPELWKKEEKKKLSENKDNIQNSEVVKTYLQQGVFSQGFLVNKKEFTRRKVHLEKKLKFKTS